MGLVVGAGLLTGLTIIDFVSDRVDGHRVRDTGRVATWRVFLRLRPRQFGVAGSDISPTCEGILSVGDVVYYLSVTAVFLLLTVIALETRRWR